jgi:hypothetical protein
MFQRRTATKQWEGRESREREEDAERKTEKNPFETRMMAA